MEPDASVAVIAALALSLSRALILPIATSMGRTGGKAAIDLTNVM
jgi:hypothetical protein